MQGEQGIEYIRYRETTDIRSDMRIARGNRSLKLRPGVPEVGGKFRLDLIRGDEPSKEHRRLLDQPLKGAIIEEHLAAVGERPHPPRTLASDLVDDVDYAALDVEVTLAPLQAQEDTGPRPLPFQILGPEHPERILRSGEWRSWLRTSPERDAAEAAGAEALSQRLTGREL